MTVRLALAASIALLLVPPGVAAQVRTVDPSSPDVAAARGTAPADEPVDPGDDRVEPAPAAEPAPPAPADAPRPAGEARISPQVEYRDEEIFGAAEETFGKGAKGLAQMVENVLKKQGRPTAYIAGREAGGAIAVGLRYGQGTLYHKVEGSRPVFWQGPSLGFDIGGNGAKTFILVYNLHDGEELFRRFPLVEGNLYAIGGFTASYLRRGDIALVPIRLGVGWRFGASVGYMNFSKEGRVIPF